MNEFSESDDGEESIKGENVKDLHTTTQEEEEKAFLINMFKED